MKKLILLAVISILCASFAFTQVTVSYKCANTSVSTNQIKPHINLINTGSTAIDLETLKVRYYYTKEGTAGEQLSVDYAAIGKSQITGNIETGYAEITFLQNTGSIRGGGQTGDIQLRIFKTDWSVYDQTNDYSFDPTKTAYTEWENITLYENDILIWGTEPSGPETPEPTDEPTQTPVSTETPVPTMTPAVTPLAGGYTLNVITEGTDNPIPIHYWGDFSGTDTTPLSFHSDVPYRVDMEAGKVDIKEDFTSGYYLWTWSNHAYYERDNSVWSEPIESGSFTIYSTNPVFDMKLKYARYEDEIILPTPLPTPLGTSGPTLPPLHVSFTDFETGELIPDSDITASLYNYSNFNLINTWNSSEIVIYESPETAKLLHVLAPGYHELLIYTSSIYSMEPVTVNLYKESYATPVPENTPIRLLSATATPAPKTDAAWYNFVNLAPPDIEVVFGNTVQAVVDLSYHHTGYRVVDWGVPDIRENSIILDAQIIEWDGAAAFWNTEMYHTYDFGRLTEGETYSIEFREWGKTIDEFSFTVDTPVSVDPIDPAWQVQTDPLLTMEKVIKGDTTYMLLTAAMAQNLSIAHKIQTWGEVTRNGTVFTVNPVFLRSTEASNTISTYNYHSYLYNLGELDLGTYTFKVVSGGTEIFSEEFSVVETFAPIPTIQPLPTTAPESVPVVRTYLTSDKVSYPGNTITIAVRNYGAPCTLQTHEFLTDSAISITPGEITLGTIEEAVFTVTVDWSQLNGVSSSMSNNAFIVTDSNVYREYLPWEFLLENNNPGLLTISGKIEQADGITMVLSGDAHQEIIPDSSGNYSFTSLTPGGNYIVTPHYDPPAPMVSVQEPSPNAVLSGVETIKTETQGAVCVLAFTPPEYTYAGLTNDYTAQNFTSMGISDCCVEVVWVSYSLGDILYNDVTSTMCHGSYLWEVDTTQLPDGDAILYVTAFDSAGKHTRAEVPVSIDNSTPTPEPTPVILPGAGDVWFVPENTTVDAGENFTVEIHLNSGDQLFAAYGFEIYFDPAVILARTEIGTDGVLPGPDGFLTAQAAGPVPGIVRIKGFDTSGTGPGEDLHILTVYFTATGTGTTTLDLEIESLHDSAAEIIGNPNAIDGTVTVLCTSPSGDVNGDGATDIVDALLIAQYYVGLDPDNFLEDEADVDLSGTIDIVDALLIAQYYVGLLPELPGCNAS
ncbi:MAG: hypothetical protein JXJ04_20080 [Spirochaetales bacterium]|nr:hypothetical protein [Spirochaetales bacterium]